MLWSGSKPLTVVRENMWGFLMFSGAAWLAISWSVLRLEPTDIVRVAGPVVLFGALTEAVRALAGTRTWWLNAGLAVLFAVTGAVLLTSGVSSFTRPAALVGWYLMVRGAADIAVSMLTRETDRIWGLLMVVGVVEAGLGFFAASPLSRTADPVVAVLGGLALARGVADLVAALRLREVSGLRGAGSLELPPERAAGVAGYSAGLTDYGLAPAADPAAGPASVRTGPRHRHRAAPRSSSGAAPGPADGGFGSDGSAGAPMSPGGEGSSSFHDEVLRTTAGLDAMLALAGVTGAGVAAGMADHEIPEIPDTAEGAELSSDTEEMTAVRAAAHARDETSMPRPD